MSFELRVRCEGGEAVVTLHDAGAQVPCELVSRVFEMVLQRRIASGPGASYTVRLPIPAALSPEARRKAMPPPTYRSGGERLVVGEGAGERAEALLRQLGYDARLER